MAVILRFPSKIPRHCARSRDDGSAYASARSNHAGGVVVTTADATTQMVRDDIELAIWQARSTRANGENIPDDDI